ncbi:hypothetical protein [uncultured Paracoccus sp.]|uniref:hypothetical protein n=1 Tax=uncultured Paracoccus sp. TaxID=189685 RepID=UPI0025D01204|nr:hypothetical protein [uncultured Paracoccus sp.]
MPAPNRHRDAAFAVPLFGAVLLLPVFVNLFNRRLAIWGVPLEVIYLFAVWLGLAAGAFWLSRHLRPSDEPTRRRRAGKDGG